VKRTEIPREIGGDAERHHQISEQVRIPHTEGRDKESLPFWKGEEEVGRRQTPLIQPPRGTKYVYAATHERDREIESESEPQSQSSTEIVGVGGSTMDGNGVGKKESGEADTDESLHLKVEALQKCVTETEINVKKILEVVCEQQQQQQQQQQQIANLTALLKASIYHVPFTSTSPAEISRSVAFPSAEPAAPQRVLAQAQATGGEEEMKGGSKQRSAAGALSASRGSNIYNIKHIVREEGGTIGYSSKGSDVVVVVPPPFRAAQPIPLTAIATAAEALGAGTGRGEVKEGEDKIPDHVFEGKRDTDSGGGNGGAEAPPSFEAHAVTDIDNSTFMPSRENVPVQRVERKREHEHEQEQEHEHAQRLEQVRGQGVQVHEDKGQNKEIEGETESGSDRYGGTQRARVEDSDNERERNGGSTSERDREIDNG